MALRIDLTKREHMIANNLIHGTQEWSDLPKDQKLILFECPYELDGLVEKDELRDFESELALEGYFGPSRMVKEAAKKSLPLK